MKTIKQTLYVLLACTSFYLSSINDYQVISSTSEYVYVLRNGKTLKLINCGYNEDKTITLYCDYDFIWEPLAIN